MKLSYDLKCYHALVGKLDTELKHNMFFHAIATSMQYRHHESPIAWLKNTLQNQTITEIIISFIAPPPL